MGVEWSSRKRTTPARLGSRASSSPRAVRSGAAGLLVAWRTGEGPVNTTVRDALARTQRRVLRELGARG